jgi:hypothetical protein
VPFQLGVGHVDVEHSDRRARVLHERPAHRERALAARHRARLLDHLARRLGRQQRQLHLSWPLLEPRVRLLQRSLRWRHAVGEDERVRLGPRLLRPRVLHLRHQHAHPAPRPHRSLRRPHWSGTTLTNIS